MAAALSISGAATVIDGDTIDLNGTRIRLHGIDAPEARQSCQRGGVEWACGADSTAQLNALISQNAVQCTGQESDIYGRLLAKCSVNGRDIGRELVQWGLAVNSNPNEPGYSDAEDRARNNRIGIWASQFQKPADWRAANPREDSGPRFAVETRQRVQRANHLAAASQRQIYRTVLGCAIKGNHSIRGEWIYHLPGSKHYEETRPEDLFCTEQQALAAGYRRSRAD